MKSRTVTQVCTGCGSSQLSAPVEIPNQPVIMNYRFATARAARVVPRRTLELVECGVCGLIFNRAFDEAAVPYDENYENRQDQSPVFTRHTDQVARWITGQLGPEPRILEVGCGKGVFLKSLVRLSGGTADGYDTSYEGPTGRRGRVAFHRSYISAQDVKKPYDAIVCRHVVEHVARIGDFLKELAAIATAAGVPTVFLETPRLEWIIRSRSAWDVFHEHCNYFTTSALYELCRLAGFRVIRQRQAFDGQYQLLSLQVAKRRAVAPSVTPAPCIGELGLVVKHAFDQLATRVDKMRRGGRWAVWGAGAKGMCLANRATGEPPTCLFDKNPAKQGIFVPGAAVPVVAPTAAALHDLSLVVIVNPTYKTEILSTLKSLKYQGRTLVLEKI
ncbi:MAG: class I SAM-dependent methyltransferase [Terrimicrobiaceae bacterium]